MVRVKSYVFTILSLDHYIRQSILQLSMAKQRSCMLRHIISKYGADFDVLDNDGRSPLHWYVNMENTLLIVHASKTFIQLIIYL